jgi:hypothetical protein
MIFQIVIKNSAMTDYAVGLIGNWKLRLISLTHDDNLAYNTYQHNIELRSNRVRVPYGTNRHIVYSTKQKDSNYIIQPFELISDKLDGYLDFEVFDITVGARFIGLANNYSIVLTFDAEKMEETNNIVSSSLYMNN